MTRAQRQQDKRATSLAAFRHKTFSPSREGRVLHRAVLFFTEKRLVSKSRYRLVTLATARVTHVKIERQEGGGEATRFRRQPRFRELGF